VEQPVWVGDLDLRDHLRIIRGVEREFNNEYSGLELQASNLNQSQSEEYAVMFHKETAALVKYHQEVLALKSKVPKELESKLASQFPNPLFPTPGSLDKGASQQQKRHPLIELRDLQAKLKVIRAEFESAAKNELERN
jgi:hypothetical protein